jgi:hypothetical protein
MGIKTVDFLYISINMGIMRMTFDATTVAELLQDKSINSILPIMVSPDGVTFSYKSHDELHACHVHEGSIRYNMPISEANLRAAINLSCLLFMWN